MTADIPTPFELPAATVLPEWIDMNGHMNVAYYLLAFDLASDVFSDFLGLTADYKKRTNSATFAGDVHLVYKREVKDGDEAAILGAWYERGPVALAATVSLFDDHEIDDLGRFFGGVGVELFGQVDVNDHVRLLGGFNHLQPEDVHPGDYRLTYALAGVAYRYPHGVAFFETKVEDSRRSDGVRNRRNIYGIGLRFDF